MSTTELSVRWTGEGLEYIGVDSKGNELQIGRDGISPGQMTLLGLASCMGMDVVSILKKKQQNVQDVEIDIIATQPTTHKRGFHEQMVDSLYNRTGLGLATRTRKPRC